MLSLFIMYSPDRRKQLEYTISCLQDMEHYDEIQKTLIVDGKTEDHFSGFDVVSVPRINDKFSWSNMWSAGVLTSQHEIVVYLDSDRLLPQNFLSLVQKHAVDDLFLFTSHHFWVLNDLSLDLCKRFLSNPDLLLEPEFIGQLKFEIRFQNPIYGPGKNVMSGSVAFTKTTFCRLGGVDPWYCGHGAFADTDFHLHAAVSGCRFLDLAIPELHYHHEKLEQNAPLSEIKLKQLSLDNFIYYCHKWQMKPIVAENLATEIGVPQPEKYVRNRLTELSGL